MSSRVLEYGRRAAPVELTTRGGSMFPFVPAGSRLRVAVCDPVQLRRGDIVAYVAADGALVAHRLQVPVSHSEGRAIVAGDRAFVAEPVPLHTILGKATEVHHGHWMYTTDGWLGRLLSSIAVRHRGLYRGIAGLARLVVRATPKQQA